MFITVSTELAKLVSEKYTTDSNPICDAINSLFYSMNKRKHVVMIDRQAISLLMKCDSIEYTSKAMMRWIECHYNDIYAIKCKVSIFVVLIPEKESYFSNNTYYLSIEQYQEFVESQLLTENDDDYLFYTRIYSFIYPSKKIFDICLQNNPFYGANVASRIQCLYSEKKFFLCIVDSDKEYASDGKKSTYQAANNELKNHNLEILPRELYVLNVREKENLFPFQLYLSKCPNQCQFINIILQYGTEEIFRFIKIKDGIKQKRINENNKNWNNVYSVILENCTKRNIYLNVSTEDEYCVKGINNRALKSASEPFFEKNNYNTLQQNGKIDIFFGKQLFIIEEWKEIAHKLFDYGCCFSRQVNFMA